MHVSSVAGAKVTYLNTMTEYEQIGNAMIFGVQTYIKIKLKRRATYRENEACRFWGW